MINSITLGRPSTLASADDGLRASLVADALVESMGTNGAWVKVPDRSEHNTIGGSATSQDSQRRLRGDLERLANRQRAE